MSDLAPGRLADMNNMMKARAEAKTQRRRDFLDKQMAAIRREGKDPVIHSLRERLIKATRANDLKEADKISNQIRAHTRRKGF